MARREEYEEIRYDVGWDDEHIYLKMLNSEGDGHTYMFGPEEMREINDTINLALVEFYEDFEGEQ